VIGQELFFTEKFSKLQKDMNKAFLGGWIYLSVQRRNNIATAEAHAQSAACVNKVKEHNLFFWGTV